MQPSHKKLQASILQSQQFGKYLSIMAFDHEFAPRSQKSGNQIAENVEIGQKKMLSQKNDFWKTVAFSDETMLELNNDRLLRVRRLKNRRFEPQFLAKFNGFSRKKLMICGCIRSNGDKLLILIENKVDSDAYTKILTDHVIEFLFMHEPFQQNNVVAHTSLKTKTFFWEDGLNLLENWPPQSPDINIIENLWSIFKRKVIRWQPNNLEQLWSYAQDEFFEIPQSYVFLPQSYTEFLVGQNKYTCQSLDQTTALLETGQKLVTKTYFWPLCWKEAVAFAEKVNYGKMKSQLLKCDHI